MANPAEVKAYVRFALDQLPVHNAHFDFEHICRHLTKQFFCTNVLPATGPVSAGGDQGRDFETFRTYLKRELELHGAFLGLVSEGTIAFICTTQANGVLSKLRDDIGKVFASGHPVHEIYAFTLESVPVALRHKLQTETLKSHKVHLEFHDAESIADLLARPQGFWIAEQFLSISAEIRPEVDDDSDDHSADYIDRRRRWREKDTPNPTLGEFIDLKTGLREAVFHQRAREDLPFWIGLLRQLLATPELPVDIQQRGRYELVVATFRGTGDFHLVDDVARAYLDDSLNEIEPIRLIDAQTLLLYANTAVRRGLTSLKPTEIQNWNNQLTNWIQELLPNETLHQRASLLFALGHLGLHPDLSETNIQSPDNQVPMPERWETAPGPSTLNDSSLPEDLVLTDEAQALSAWTQLMASLEEVPLFPIHTLADILQLLVPLWSKQAEWRTLLDDANDAVGKQIGKHALAARARDRAMKFVQDGRHLEALEEFHRAKIDWWAGATVRGSLLAMIFIAELYLRLWLPQASKSYALAVAYIAASKSDEQLADLISTGLLMAANADFAAGAWCGASELVELGLVAQHQFVEDGIYSEKHQEIIHQSLSNLAHITACAKGVDPDVAAHIDAMTTRLGVQEIIADSADILDAIDTNSWESVGDKGLVARPFSDLGESRYIRFSALGADWTLTAANDIESALMAERFAAAAQVMLVALAREDLCLIQTQIRVRIRSGEQGCTSDGDRIKSLPSNDGREWVVQLSPVKNSDNDNPEEIDIELLMTLTTILREASLLPDDDFRTSIERAFKSGLRNKLSPGRPYDQLVTAFIADREPEILRTRYNTPWDCGDGTFTTHEELRWRDELGPTYTKDKSKQLLQTRYVNLTKSLRFTIETLASSEEFQHTVETLRARNWLDWHILTAILNIVMDYRFPTDPSNPISEETEREMFEAAFQLESAFAEPVPIGLFLLEKMDYHRQFAMVPLLNHWGLELHQETPDIPAIERLLAKRYGYWDDGVPHDNPFPTSTDAAND